MDPAQILAEVGQLARLLAGGLLVAAGAAWGRWAGRRRRRDARGGRRMSAGTGRCVTGRLDETRGAADPKWIVDTDSPDGGCSHTLDVFAADDRDGAVEFARREADRRGCGLRIA